MADFPRKAEYAKDDRKPDLIYHVRKGEGNAVRNLTGVATVKFYMREIDASSNKIDGVTVGASVDDAVTGKLKYLWTAADLDTVGIYSAWFTYEDGAGLTETVTTVTIEVKDAWERAN